jgi:hypothetical protein
MPSIPRHPSDADLAYAWHLGEAIMVGILAIWAVIGLSWSISHRRVRLVETKRPAR